MEHFYQDISGFMSHKNTVMLDMALDQFPKLGTWVELGSWTGRSAAYCVVELLNRKKLGEFSAIGAEEFQRSGVSVSAHSIKSLLKFSNVTCL